MISAENVNKSGSFHTEIKRQQIKVNLMLGLGRTSEKFTSSVLTIHTTHVQEPGRKNVDTSRSSCHVTHKWYMVQARKAEQHVFMNEN